MHPRTRAAFALSGATAIAASLGFRSLGGRTWGATFAEAKAHLPGDDLVPAVDTDSTLAIDIDAPPDAVWPWLVQMGVDRAGFYTHTWIENGLFRLRVRNAERVVPAWQHLNVGDHIWFSRSGHLWPQFGPLVVSLNPGRVLVCSLGDDPAHRIGSWQFVLTPLGESTRLLFRSQSALNRPLALRLTDMLFETGYLYMEIGMLHGIKRRAEQSAVENDVQEPAIRAGADGHQMTVLVAFASQQGSTRQVAMAIAATLRRHHIDAQALAIEKVPEFGRYDAIVLGSAIHSSHWTRHAQAVIEKHRSTLRQKPVWLFSLGMLALDTGQPWPEPYPQDIERNVEAIGARDHRLFNGRRTLPEPKVFSRFVMESVFGLMAHDVRPAIGDFRDWGEVTRWADEIAAFLQTDVQGHAA